MRRLIAGALLLTFITGCTPAGVQPPENSPPGAAVRPVEARTVEVALPQGFEAPFLEFASISHGYAIFVKPAKDRYEAKLFRTTDGGKSWQELTHPHPVTKTNHQLYVVGPESVVLLAEPDGWFVTSDGGKTWATRPISPSGQVPAEYPDYQSLHLLNGRPLLPDFSKSAVREDGQRRLWLTAIKDGAPITAVSGPNDKTFRRVPVEPQPGREVIMAEVSVSPDGQDVWLIAHQAPIVTGGQRSARKGGGMPLLWLLDGEKWVQKPILGLKEVSHWQYVAQPVGGKLLLLTTPESLVYFSDKVVSAVSGLPKVSYVGMLRDGTVYASGNDPSARYFSVGAGADRSWIRVQLSRS